MTDGMELVEPSVAGEKQAIRYHKHDNLFFAMIHPVGKDGVQNRFLGIHSASDFSAADRLFRTQPTIGPIFESVDGVEIKPRRQRR